MKRYLLSAIQILIIVNTLFGQKSSKQYQFPNTYLTIPYPNAEFKSTLDVVGMFNIDTTAYIRAINFKIEEEEFADYLYVEKGIDTLFKKEIDGGILHFNWSKIPILGNQKDSMFLYIAKIYIDSLNNYLVACYQKNDKANLKEDIVKSFLQMRIDTSKKIDPFLSKSFWLDLTKTNLFHCKEFKSDWMVKLTSDATEFPKGKDKSYLFIKAFPITMTSVLEEKLIQNDKLRVLDKEEIKLNNHTIKKYIIEEENISEYIKFVYYADVGAKTYEIEGKLYDYSIKRQSELDEFVKTIQFKKE